MQLLNKTILVTGAGSGIGRELSLQLLQKNIKVVGIDINYDALLETQKLAFADSSTFKPFVLDITDNQKVIECINAAITHFGALDGIINNAGIIQKFIPVNEMNLEDIHRVMNVNFYGTVYLTKAILPHLLTRPEAHIINISSMGGFMPFPRQTIYGATKAAVKIFTEGLYAELKDTNVRVTVVHPGAIATNITANSGLGIPKLQGSEQETKLALPAAKAAEKIIDAISRNKYRVTVGKDALFLDILYRLFPQFATNFIGKMMKKTLKDM